jgi:hypothetical protein
VLSRLKPGETGSHRAGAEGATVQGGIPFKPRRTPLADVEAAYSAFQAARKMHKGSIAIDLNGWARIDFLTLVTLCRQEASEAGGSLALSLGEGATRRLHLPNDSNHLALLLEGVPCSVSRGAPELVLAYRP